MKKILILILAITGLVLFSVYSAKAAGVPGGQGGKTPEECCIIKHNLDKLPGDPNSNGPEAGARVGPKKDIDCQGTTTDYASPHWAAYCAIDTVYTVTDWIFWIAFVFAGVVIIVGGLLFMTSGGNPDKTKNAKNLLVYGIIGILVAVLAKLIPAFARFFVGA